MYEKISRRDFLKLSGVAAAFLAGCGHLEAPELQTNPEITNPFSLKNQVFVDGRIITPDEIVRSMPDSFAMNKIMGLNGYMLGNDLAIKIYTDPADKENPNLSNRITKAIEIRRRPSIFNESGGMTVYFSDGRYFETEKTFEYLTYGTNPQTRETYYDPKTNSIYTERKLYNQTDNAVLQDEISPMLNDLLPNELYSDQIHALLNTVKRIYDLGGGKKRPHIELTRYEFDMETGESKEVPVITSGSLWYNRIRRISKILTKDEDLQGNEAFILNFVSSLADKSFDPDIEDTANPNDNISWTLQLLGEKFVSSWNNSGYQKYFIDSGIFSIEDQKKAFHTLFLLVYGHIEKFQKLTPAQLGELVELLMYKKYFVPDVNTSRNIFNNIITDLALPEDYADQGGMFFSLKRAGENIIYDHNAINKLISKEYEDKINSTTDKTIIKNLKKELKIKIEELNELYKRLNKNSENTYNVETHQPLIIGYTEHRLTPDNSQYFQYKVVKYKYDGKPPEVLFSLRLDDPYLDFRVPGNATSSINDSNGNVITFRDGSAMFNCEKSPIANPEALRDLGIEPWKEEENPNLPDGENDIIKVYNPHILHQKLYWRRETDVDKYKFHYGIPYQRKFGPNGEYNTTIFFYDDAPIIESITNKQMIQDEQIEVMTDATHLIETARKQGRRAINKYMYGSIGELAKLMVEGPINFVKSDNSLTCRSIAETGILSADPNDYEGFLKNIWPNFKSLAYVGADTHIFTGTYDGLFETIVNSFKGQKFVSLQDLQPLPNQPPFKAGGYISIDGIAFFNDVPYGHISGETGTADFYVPLNTLFFEKTDTAIQNAVFLATILTAEIGLLTTSPGQAVSSFIIKNLLKIIVKTVGLII